MNITDGLPPPAFPGVPATADGSDAVVWVETHISQGACTYPITPATRMGDGFQLAYANGAKNLWGDELFFLEPESEHSAASACEGFALAGGRVSNFTAGQGLVLMKEALYTIAGKRLPAVFHIGARALTSQALNVHAGHDDVMAVADTGWGMLFARNAQEAHDLALIARRTAEAARTPFMVVQDGFLTTHTIESLRLAEPELMRELIDDPHRLPSYFDAQAPLMTGVVQNQDSYMDARLAQRCYTDAVAEHFNAACVRFAELTGRRYAPVHAYRLEDADYALVGLGSAMDTAMAAVDWMRTHLRLKVGVLHVTAFRPFPGAAIATALKNCRAVAILERTDNPLAKDNPLTLEIKAAFADAVSGAPYYRRPDRMPRLYSGVYGLGSRDVRAADFIAAVEHMADCGRRFFSLGADHRSALARTHDPDVRPPGSYSLRGHSIGGFGSVATNKLLATLLADVLGLQVQAYPKYGSEKKGLPTTYYLTAAPTRVRAHSELAQVEFVAVHDANAFADTEPLAGLADGGVLYVQCRAAEVARLTTQLPMEAIARRGIAVYLSDAAGIGRDLATQADLALRMQGVALLGAFLRISPLVAVREFESEALFARVAEALRKQFSRRGEAVVQANLAAVRRGYHELQRLIPAAANAYNRAEGL